MTRRAALVAGTLVLVAVWLWPRPQALLPAFSAHMALHMAVVAVAAPLLALAVAGGPLDPVRRLPWWRPIPLSLVELVSVWAWHTPALHELARHTAGGLVVEQGSFLLAGLLLWTAALGGSPAERRARATGGVTALLLTSMHMTLLGALLVLAPRALFVHHPGGHAILGLSAAQDQHLGGAVMILFGGLVYLGGGLALVADALRGGR